MLWLFLDPWTLGNLDAWTLGASWTLGAPAGASARATHHLQRGPAIAPGSTVAQSVASTLGCVGVNLVRSHRGELGTPHDIKTCARHDKNRDMMTCGLFSFCYRFACMRWMGLGTSGHRRLEELLPSLSIGAARSEPWRDELQPDAERQGSKSHSGSRSVVGSWSAAPYCPPGCPASLPSLPPPCFNYHTRGSTSHASLRQIPSSCGTPANLLLSPGEGARSFF
jgi:hypothetical protein